MKIVSSQSDLKNNLSLVSRAVPSRAEPAVLANVLIEATETSQKVSMTAFDGSMGIKTSFNAEVIEGGSITLPAKLFNDIVARLPEMEITLSVAEEENNFIATISSTSGEFRLAGIDAEEFPELPQVKGEQVMELPIAIVNEGLGGCLFAASTELSKQVLTGVHLKTKVLGESDRADILEFAATDSHRLAVVATDLNQEDIESESVVSLPDFAVTIPAKALRELERIVADAGESDRIKVSFDEVVMVFELGDRLLTSAKIPGDYPAYGQLIPQNFAREMIVDRKRLLSSLELVAVLAQKNNLVKFSLSNDLGELTVSADAQDVGNAKQSLPAEIMGEDIEIAFNIKYLMDGLKALPTAEIKMQLNEWNQPVIFSPLGGLDMTYLVMPVQIRN
ncbi:DNA polymerase III subunit beta [Waterburya agarophytonicola K14]|uniref:Beta sliding clamp n=1 Tax=Waterburya agarophytonicola KI4 TaxID=2874699 RepID=A0A964FGL8_9CYAN|nr:DNA polymerase III subunit beta [Waterburya agarophytonicola]MCC0176608.1 DNA polymerase III subunit beta [Waterburya agarophytonicola KI4]